MALIKKKDVESYFAARRARHPLHNQRKNISPATKASPIESASLRLDLQRASEHPGICATPRRRAGSSRRQ